MKKILAAFAIIFMLYTGLTWGVIGVLINNMAQYYNVNSSSIVASFSVFTCSATIMVIFSTGLLVEYLNIKKVLILSSILTVFGAILLFVCNDIVYLKLSLFIFGIGYGICFALSYYFIVLTTNHINRASKMALISFCFSIGTALSPLLGGGLINSGISWQVVFTCFTIVMIPIGLITLFMSFDVMDSSKNVEKITKKISLILEVKSWPITVYIMAFGLLIYELAETTMIVWLVVYGENNLHLNINAASKLLSIFWFFVIIGRIVASFVLKKIKPELYIILVTIMSGIFLLIFSYLNSTVIVSYILIALIGFGFSALYSTLTSLGTTQIKTTSPRLVSLLLGAGCVGTILAPLVTSYVKLTWGLQNVFFVCSGFMFSITILSLMLCYFQKRLNS
jgi:fucose permease